MAVIAPQILEGFHFEVLKTPANSPDLATTDYYLFRNLQNLLEGRKFSSIEEATLAWDARIAAQTNE
jgi:hypothetical protein